MDSKYLRALGANEADLCVNTTSDFEAMPKAATQQRSEPHFKALVVSTPHVQRGTSPP